MRLIQRPRAQPSGERRRSDGIKVPLAKRAAFSWRMPCGLRGKRAGLTLIGVIG